MRLSKQTWLIVALASIPAASALSYEAGQQSGGQAQPGARAQPVGVVTGRGVIRGFHYAVSDEEQNVTMSTAFVPVPDMSVEFTLGATGNVLITFDAEAWAPDNGIMYVTARVDGVDAQPGEVQFTGDSDEDEDGLWARAHHFQWVFPGVPPGSHTVEILFRSYDGGNVSIHGRSLVVMHG